MSVAFSLIIPCYNEAANLPLLVDRCVRMMDREDVEVILVDNGSRDATPELLPALLADHPFMRSIRVEINQGYGFGIIAGLRQARGEILAWTHADLQTDPGDALRGLRLLEACPDRRRVFFKGRRYGRPLADVIFTVGMSLFETLLLGQRFWDVNAQPVIFSRDFFQTWHDPPTDFSLDLFAYYQARQAGLAIHRFPVLFGERAHGVSHWNVNWQGKYRFIRRTVDYSITLRKKIQAEE